MESRRTFKDQIGRNLTINFPPKRIVSLVPSQTEYIVDVGLTEELVGITKFCIRPPSIIQEKTKVGGTKNINPEIIKELNPDLLIANKEENEKSQIEELAIHFPVYVSDVNSLAQALEMMEQLGKICQRDERAKEITEKVKEGFMGLKPAGPIPRCIYLIWKNPYMAAGSGNFINEMLTAAGFRNLLGQQTLRYPSLQIEEIKALAPEVILLSSEPYPFKEKHLFEFMRLMPESKVLLVDGEMFSWYGSRLLRAPEYFKNLRAQLANS